MDAKLNEMLKSRRGMRRYSLQHVHRETRISMAYLEALESGRWDAFPAEVYLVGFLKKYSAYLGLDPEEMAQLYQQEIQTVKIEKQEELKKEVQVKKKEETQSLLRSLVLVFFVVIFGGWWIYTMMELQTGGKKAIDPVQLKKKFSRSAFVQGGILSLDAQSMGHVWIRVTADKKLLFEGFLSSGTNRNWTGHNEILVRIGNVNLVNLSLNSYPVDVRARSNGGVNEIRLTHQSFNASSNVLPQNSESPGMSAALESDTTAVRSLPVTNSKVAVN